MKPEPGADRRKYPRIRSEAVVSIARLAEGPTLGHTLDLSLGGIRFQCVGVELELGERVRVTLTLGGRTIEVIGELVRVVDLDAFTQEVALAFLELDPEQLVVLTEELPESYEY